MIKHVQNLDPWFLLRKSLGGIDFVHPFHLFSSGVAILYCTLLAKF